jgi:hypothetical protein
MKTTIKFFAVITACVFFTSCQQEEITPERPSIYHGSSTNGDAAKPEAARLDAVTSPVNEVAETIKTRKAAGSSNKGAFVKRKNLL